MTENTGRKRSTARKKAPPTEAIKLAREVANRLAELGIGEEAEDNPPPRTSAKSWEATVRRLRGGIATEVIGEWDSARRGATSEPNFTPLSPAQVAEPIDLQTWRIKGFWSLGSHGVWAGPKKSFKTTLHDCMAIGCASGESVLGQFEVEVPGPVLIYAGEGSLEWRRRDLQRIARDVYGVKIGSRNGDAEIYIVDQAYPFDAPEFRRALAANIRDIEPAFVTLDSTYNYHPRASNNADMYERGPLFAQLGHLVRDANPETSLLLIDHMRQQSSHDLDAIAMAGVGQWADSWILNIVQDADVESGQFTVQMSIGSRRWGGKERLAEVNLGPFGENDWANEWDIKITHGEWSRKSGGGGISDNKLDARIIKVVEDNPFVYTPTALVSAVEGGKTDRKRERVEDLLDQRLLVLKKVEAQEGKRKVVRERVGLPEEPGDVKRRKQPRPKHGA